MVGNRVFPSIPRLIRKFGNGKFLARAPCKNQLSVPRGWIRLVQISGLLFCIDLTG